MDQDHTLKLKRTYEQELSNNTLTFETKFAYAWALGKSDSNVDLNEANTLYKELLVEFPDMSRDLYFLLSETHLKIGKFELSKMYVNKVLEIESKNKQAISLLKKIKEKEKREATIGVLSVAGAAVAAGIALKWLFGNKGRS